MVILNNQRVGRMSCWEFWFGLSDITIFWGGIGCFCEASKFPYDLQSVARLLVGMFPPCFLKPLAVFRIPIFPKISCAWGFQLIFPNFSRCLLNPHPVWKDSKFPRRGWHILDVVVVSTGLVELVIDPWQTYLPSWKFMVKALRKASILCWSNSDMIGHIIIADIYIYIYKYDYYDQTMHLIKLIIVTILCLQPLHIYSNL